MIPYKIRLSGFLSYQDPVELDFTGLTLACISGSNGAGKSTILDAITWALFGEARTRDDDALVNSSVQVKAAEVVFDFQYETNLYRVQRTKPRGKTTVLEFYVLSPDGAWRALTEKSVRETENRLKQILRLDYETFINASFFLQGKADQFAQQQPANRKKVLSSVLGLEIWETYRAQAAETRRTVEYELRGVDAQLEEINNELDQEESRKARLAEIERQLAEFSQVRKAKEEALSALQRLASSLAEQKRLVDVLLGRLDETRARVQQAENQRENLAAERSGIQSRLARAAEVEASYQRWLADRDELARWEKVAASFFEIQNKRAAPLMEINGEEKRLQEELRRLRADEQSIRQLETRAKLIEAGLPELRGNVEAIQAQQGRRGALEEELALKRQRIGELTAENTRLRAEMNDMKERIDSLKQVDGADCPLCGKPLSETERLNLLSDLEAEGRQKGDLYRENVAQQKRDEESLKDLQAELTALTRLDQQLLTEHRKLDQAETELKRLRDTLETWEASGAMRLLDLQEQITKGMFALDARSRLAAIDQEARSLGYEAAAHDAVRASEQAGRGAELALRELESARAALEPLERQLDGLGRQIELDRAQQVQQEQEYTAASQKYAAEASALPDLNLVEREMLHAQSEENRLRMDVGMVRQLVAVLDSLRERKARQVKRRSDLMVTITRLKALERAFSKDGVPALLIEQALPDIEAHANDLLERLSAGGMSVRFATQRALKSKKEEMRETLDIIISDSFGERPYEMFSGGEAFRVNFAIRLALSRVLAHRAGARLQTLFIDEGFGSQDAEGRQRLLEAISLVQTEFERILVITHLEELKEAFPARIEVEKTQRGSSLKVVL